MSEKAHTVIEDAQRKSAMASPVHLKKWLRETRRHFVILKADDLVDSLPWPEGVDSIIQMIECYRQHRAVRVEEDIDDKGRPYNRYQDDKLELDELHSLKEFVDALVSEEEQRLDEAQKRATKCKGGNQ